MTIREMIVHTLSWPPYDRGATATQIMHFLLSTHRTVKLSSLSGQLCRMAQAGELEVFIGYGPRGGNGYVLKGSRR